MTGIAISLNWQFSIIVNPGVSGITLCPPACEPLVLCFTPDGNTCGVAFWNPGSPRDEYYSTIHVKTIYAGVEIHKALIDMLAYLSKKYFQAIEVYDEAGYWHSGDVSVLLSHFESDSKDLNKLSPHFGNLALSPGAFGWITQTLHRILNASSGSN